MKNVIYTIPADETQIQKAQSIPGLNIHFVKKEEVTADLLNSADALIGGLSRKQMEQCPHLQWVQLSSAGVNSFLWLPESVTLCNASGAYGEAISEYMLACTLSVMKKLPRYFLQQQDHDWTNLGSVPCISRSSVLSVGAGDIGTHYLHKMHLLGARTCGIRRSIHDQSDWMDRLCTFDQLEEVLPKADIIALSLPETPETIHLFDQHLLSLCKKGSILINVGRGTAIVTEDLMKLAQKHWFSGICLDVTDPEPLPRNHPLWAMENVYITPHISGRFNAELTRDNINDLILDNLNRYAQGSELTHIVDRRKGY